MTPDVGRGADGGVYDRTANSVNRATDPGRPRGSGARARWPRSPAGRRPGSPRAPMTSSGRPVPSSGWNRVRVVSDDGRPGLRDANIDHEWAQVVLDGPVALRPLARKACSQRGAWRRARRVVAGVAAGELHPVVRCGDPARQRGAGQPHVVDVDEPPAVGQPAGQALRGPDRAAIARSGRCRSARPRPPCPTGVAPRRRSAAVARAVGTRRSASRPAAIAVSHASFISRWVRAGRIDARATTQPPSLTWLPRGGPAGRPARLVVCRTMDEPDPPIGPTVSQLPAPRRPPAAATVAALPPPPFVDPGSPAAFAAVRAALAARRAS